MPPTPERGGEGENRSAIGWCPCIWFCGSRVSPIRLLLSVYFRFRVSAITEAPKNNQSVYVADRPANKTAPRSATDASSPTPCGVQPHGRGSGSKHVDALRDSVRSWRRSAQKSRPSSKNGKATMPNDTCHPEAQCQGMTHRMASVRSFKIARMPPKQRHLPPRRSGGEQVQVRRKMKHEKTHPTDAVTQTYPGLSTYVPIVKPASRAQLEMERCRWQAIVANNFASGMVA